jgi:hypothetical protein
LKFHINDLTIEIVEDKAYSLNSSDNSNVYNAELLLEECELQSDYNLYTSKYCVELRRSDEVVRKVIVVGPTGLLTRVSPGSALIDGNSLILIIGDFVCSLSILNLEMNWKVKTSCITCFKVFHFDNAFLIHGEVEIVKVSRFGSIEWSFSGRDIFVSPEGNSELEIHEDIIYIRDWDNNLYKLSKDGKQLN